MQSFTQRNSVLLYFALTFAISWAGALMVAAPKWMRGETLSKQGGILLFPIMILGPCISGLVLTYLTSETGAVRRLLSQMALTRASLAWYLVLVFPPLLIWGVLFLMSKFVSPHFAPNLFWQGVLFGVPAGFIEEIGWTGFALPHMLQRGGMFPQSVLLGLLWGLWHAPAIDYLGAATPHGSYLLPFFLAFIVALTALRILIAWVYVNTGSLLLAQLVHVSSTGSLVAFSPPGVTAGEEALWYLAYAAALWILVALVLLRWGQQFRSPRANASNVER